MKDKFYLVCSDSKDGKCYYDNTTFIMDEDEDDICNAFIKATKHRADLVMNRYSSTYAGHLIAYLLRCKKSVCLLCPTGYYFWKEGILQKNKSYNKVEVEQKW